MKNVSKFIWKYWYLYVLGIVVMGFSIALDMFPPRITASIIDDVVVAKNYGIFKSLIIAIVLITVGRSILQYLKELIFDYIGVKIVFDMRKNLFDHIQGLSYSFFARKNTGELMTRIKDDVDKVWYAVSFGIMLVIEVVIHSTTVLILMFRRSPELSILAIVIMPIVAYIALQLEKNIGKVYEDISEQNAKLNTVAQENISGVRLVKAFAREKFELNKFFENNKAYYDLNVRQSKVVAKYHPNIQFVTRLLPVLIVVLGGSHVINGKLTIGELVEFSAYASMIVWPMEIIGWLTNVMAEASASQKKINKLLHQESEIKETENPVKVENINGNVEFKNVSLTLGESKILDDISFSIKQGKTLGIMGATGTGKSSIINLLVRFYDTTTGEVRIDGHNIKDYTLKDLRSSISLVMQDVFLFSDTIEENIKLGGKKDIDYNTMVEAANNAQASNFIEKMENQYQTVIGERGIGLSGGQKQRISIARALARKAPIIVFDDSTSALDMETEHLIQKTLNSLKDVTKIVIGHRISAVKNADEIIVLEDGKIVERGNHKQLLALKGRYHDTFNEQYDNLA